MNVEIKKIIFRKNLQSRINLLLDKNNKKKETKKDINLILNNKNSKYSNALLNKKINSEMMLLKSKFDYYLDKLRNNKIFRRDYSLINIKKNPKNINTESFYKYKFNNLNNNIKNKILPDIFNYQRASEEFGNKFKIIKKNMSFSPTNYNINNISFNNSMINKYTIKNENDIINKHYHLLDLKKRIKIYFKN
jgi:hypothetical protein